MPLPRVASAGDAASLQSAGGGDGLAMPDMDHFGDFSSGKAASASLWWGIASAVLCIGLLLHSGFDVPWWVAVIVIVEALLSFRRVVMYLTGSGGDTQQKASRRRRLRHFISVKLLPGAPVDDVIASFFALDQLPGVQSLELGSNSSREGLSRKHDLGFFITLHSEVELRAFLASPERATFMESLQSHIDELFIFDFESGVVHNG